MSVAEFKQSDLEPGQGDGLAFYSANYAGLGGKLILFNCRRESGPWGCEYDYRYVIAHRGDLCGARREVSAAHP